MDVIDQMRPPDVDRELNYRSRWIRPTGRCRLRAWHDEQIAVVTELADNPGASVTNASEDVAAAVEAAVGGRIESGGWMLVEHYPPDGRRGATFAVVHFSWRDNQGRPVGAVWGPVRDRELSSLLAVST